MICMAWGVILLIETVVAVFIASFVVQVVHRRLAMTSRKIFLLAMMVPVAIGLSLRVYRLPAVRARWTNWVGLNDWPLEGRIINGPYLQRSAFGRD